MKSLILLVFIIGLIFIVVGYMKNYNNCPLPKIEYRFIPRNFYDEQLSSPNISEVFKPMFQNTSVWLNYPFNNNYFRQNAYNFGNYIENAFR